MPKTTNTTATRAGLGLTALAAVLLLSADTVVGGAGRGAMPVFQGSSAGSAVAFTPVALPPVADGPFNAAPGLAPDNAFSPDRDDLASGQTVITTEDQMKYAWRRLFGGAYPAGAFDFDNEFVVLMGSGLTDATFEFVITSVELSEAAFADEFNTLYPKELLAVTATTIQPGVPPKKKKDPVWMISAVSIDRTLLRDDVVFGYVELPLP